MKRLGLLALMLAGIAPAWATDYVQLYGSPNRTFLCDAYLPYFDTTGSSIYYADQCVQVGEDWYVYPQFPPQAIYVSLDFPTSRTAPVRRYCQFVSHTDSPNGDTSWTNVDCR